MGGQIMPGGKDGWIDGQVTERKDVGINGRKLVEEEKYSSLTWKLFVTKQ